MEDLLRIKHTAHTLKAGNVLISVPFMGDSYFDRTLVLLIDHNPEGSFGLILNKKINQIPLKFVKTDIKKKLQVYNGGPVELNHLFFLHTYGSLMGKNTYISDGVSFGGQESELVALMKDNLLDENNIRFYLGYAGWSAGQLEQEIKADMWVIGAFRKDLAFADTVNVWRMAVADLGNDYTHWLQFPDKAYYN